MANAFADLVVGYAEDGSTVGGVELRRGNAFATTGGAAGLTARGGVRPSRGNPLGATLPGGMFVRVQPGVAAVPGPTGEGAYILTLSAQTDLAVTSANGTNPRIDTLGLEMVPGSPDLWRLRMLDGAPNAAPTVPAYTVPGGFFLPLADIRVNAAVSVPTSVTDRRQYTAAAGGIVQAPGIMDLSKASRDAATDLMPVGTPVWDDTNSTFGVVDGARRLVPIGISEPVTVLSSVLNTSGWANNWSDRRRLPESVFNATFARSGWAYVEAELDLQPVSNGWIAAYANLQLDAVPMAPDRALMYSASGVTDTQRRPYTLRMPTPVFFTGGVARELCIATGSFAAAGVWNLNTILWTVVQP